jgi:hypothetical protein
MDKFIAQLKADLEAMNQAQLLRVAREEFGIHDWEDYTQAELIEQCLLVETENAFH